jgi:hypothetical protein
MVLLDDSFVQKIFFFIATHGYLAPSTLSQSDERGQQALEVRLIEAADELRKKPTSVLEVERRPCQGSFPGAAGADEVFNLAPRLTGFENGKSGKKRMESTSSWSSSLHDRLADGLMRGGSLFADQALWIGSLFTDP